MDVPLSSTEAYGKKGREGLSLLRPSLCRTLANASSLRVVVGSDEIARSLSFSRNSARAATTKVSSSFSSATHTHLPPFRSRYSDSVVCGFQRPISFCSLPLEILRSLVCLLEDSKSGFLFDTASIHASVTYTDIQHLSIEIFLYLYTPKFIFW